MISLTPGTRALAAVLLFVALCTPVRAGQGEPWRDEILRLGQVTGDDAFKGQLAELLEDKHRADKLLAAGLKLAKAKDPDLTYPAALTLAQVALEHKDLAACETFYRVCMAQAVKLQSSSKIAESFGGLIYALYDHKKYASAANVCRELLEVKTGDDKERTYLIEKEDALGESYFDIDPTFNITRKLQPEVHRLMIMAIAKDGRYAQALKLVDNLVLQKDQWKDRQLRAWVLNEAGKLSEAAKVYEDVIERVDADKNLTQEGKEYYSERYRYALSNIYVELKQIDKAAEHLKILIASHPQDPGFYNDLGYIWADNDMNLKEAEQMIRKALDLDREQRKKDPNFKAADDHDKGAYLDSLGWVLFKQKRYEEAKKYLLLALKDKDAQHIEIFDHLAETYLALGQNQAALDAWRQGLKVAGDERREQQRKADVEKKIAKYMK
jgi:tetratricopeptide (TPR) repeat protein